MAMPDMRFTKNVMFCIDSIKTTYNVDDPRGFVSTSYHVMK